MPTRAYAGIDVAFAKTKRLPVCVCTWEGGRLVPVALKAHGLSKPPRGAGNRGALDPEKVERFARDAGAYLDEVEARLQLSIQVVAIDAPSAPCKPGRKRRAAEEAMDRIPLSCIATPTRAQFEEKRKAALRHLAAGKPVSRLPNANQFWMLAGFALFHVIGKKRECLEVYPHAIVKALEVAENHKTRADGYRAQLSAAARATKNSARGLEEALSRAVYGARHDRLDAFLAAWVAATPWDDLVPYGEMPDDVIWVPGVPIV